MSEPGFHAIDRALQPRKSDGGPAFPRPRSVDGSGERNYPHPAQEGMSLRDYFAAQALCGLLGSERTWPDAQYAEVAYRVADVMLVEREKRVEPAV